MAIVMSLLFGLMVWSSLVAYLAIRRPKSLLRLTANVERITYRLHPTLREGRRVLHSKTRVRVARRRGSELSPVQSDVVSALVNLGNGAMKARQTVQAVSQGLEPLDFETIFRASVQAIALESVGRPQVARAC